MKKVFLLFIVILCLLNCESWDKGMKHFESELSGLNRKITLYSDNGTVIREWEGKFMIEVTSNVISWIDENDKEWKCSGTFIVEEK